MNREYQKGASYSCWVTTKNLEILGVIGFELGILFTTSELYAMLYVRSFRVGHNLYLV
jgi:hypothetical protein